MGRTIGRADMNGSDYKDASELQVVTLVFPKQKDIKKQPMFTCLQK